MCTCSLMDSYLVGLRQGRFHLIHSLLMCFITFAVSIATGQEAVPEDTQATSNATLMQPPAAADQTTLVQNEEMEFALQPIVDVTGKKNLQKRGRKGSKERRVIFKSPSPRTSCNSCHFSKCTVDFP